LCLNTSRSRLMLPKFTKLLFTNARRSQNPFCYTQISGFTNIKPKTQTGSIQTQDSYDAYRDQQREQQKLERQEKTDEQHPANEQDEDIEKYSPEGDTNLSGHIFGRSTSKIHQQTAQEESDQQRLNPTQNLQEEQTQEVSSSTKQEQYQSYNQEKKRGYILEQDITKNPNQRQDQDLQEQRKELSQDKKKKKGSERANKAPVREHKTEKKVTLDENE